MKKAAASYLELVKPAESEIRILMQMVNVLSETHNLGLTETRASIEKCFFVLHEEALNKDGVSDQFVHMSQFITRLIQSDSETLDEFLQYLETKH